MADGPLRHVVCRTCASDDEARAELGIPEFCHEAVTRNSLWAHIMVHQHRGAGHDVSVARLGSGAGA